MFADFRTSREHVLRNLKFDVGSLTASIEFSHLETIDVVVNDVETDDETLTATVAATRSNNVGNITFTDNADLQLILNELHATRQEVAELRQQLLAKDSEQGQRLITSSTVRFQRTTSSLQIGSFRVTVSVNSKQAQLARILVSTPENITKKWDIEDLIFEAFGERIENEHNWINKIRNYVHQLNQKVLIASGGTVDNFFILDGVEVYINPEHINL
jgi:hypothetical protein